MLLCLLPLSSRPHNLLLCSVFLLVIRGEGGRGKEEPTEGVTGRFLPLPVTLIHGCPWGWRVCSRRSLGLREQSCSSGLAGERLRSEPGEKGGQAERRGHTCARELGGKAAGWLWENKIK